MNDRFTSIVKLSFRDLFKRARVWSENPGQLTFPAVS